MKELLVLSSVIYSFVMIACFCILMDSAWEENNSLKEFKKDLVKVFLIPIFWPFVLSFEFVRCLNLMFRSWLSDIEYEYEKKKKYDTENIHKQNHPL